LVFYLVFDRYARVLFAASCTSSPHHRPDDLHDRPLFLLIRSFQQFFYLFGLDPARLKVGKFEQVLDFNLKRTGYFFMG